MDKKTILIVEDDKNNMKFMGFTLTKEGYNILEAYDGITALEILKDNIPDCIILDVILPDIEGYAILDEIKANINFKDVPVIISSGKQEVKTSYKFRKGNKPEVFLAKPFTARELVQTVNEVLRKKL